jgi:hypothetical protein
MLLVEPQKHHRKDLANFHKILHVGFAAHWRAGGSRYSETTYNPLNAFLPSHLTAWVPHVLRYWFQGKHKFRDYSDGIHGNGIIPIEDHTTVALMGDWGTGTDEAQLVGECVRRSDPDYTIHLGDVYFVGDTNEIKENFLGEHTSPYDPVKWPFGKWGSFALSGNHEMYARGRGFYEVILPRMGLRKEGGEWGEGQWASFFCLENRYWRIIGLDTGYNATGFDWGKMPVLERSQWLRKSTRFKPRCNFPNSLLHWLVDRVNPNQDHRGLVLLTHHGCHSAFSDWYQIPARQLAAIIQRPVIWFWGHEHKLALYDRFCVQNEIEAYGRCLGHAGMPVERGKLSDIECPLLTWDNRRYVNGEEINVGFNGSCKSDF